MSGAAHQSARLLAFLALGSAKREAAAGGATVMLRGPRGAITVPQSILDQAQAGGLIETSGEDVSLTEFGRQQAARQRSLEASKNADAQRQIGTARVETSEGWETVAVNLDESPLASLARRTGPDGNPYLSPGEIRAGERLRSDFTRGQLMPRLGANWSGSVSSGRQAGSRGGIGDLTDAALAARQRVEHAIAATGPELSGILLDICCFLKGLEQVERERRWPVRSAKLMLKAALGALARHYEPRRDVGSRSMLHWGAEDFRPSLR